MSPVLPTGSALLLFSLTACAVGPNYRTPRTDAPPNFAASAPQSKDSMAASDRPVDRAQWWHSFDDSELDSLVDRAIRANPDIEIALTRLQEAREQRAVLIGDALPEVAASAAAGRGTGSDATVSGALPALRAGENKGDLGQIRQVAGFAASWELDLFGGYRRAVEAGRYDVETAAAARNVVLLSVIADVARNYVDLRGLQQRLAILENNIATARDSRDYEQVRFDRGLTNELDLQLAIREYEALLGDLPLLQNQITVTAYRIALLLGEYPEQLGAELEAPGKLPELPARIDTGMPLELLQRRPDVRAAERRLAAATARIGVATAALFPRLAVTGGLGTQSDTIGAHGSHIWDLGPSVYWPLLDFGALDAQVNVADLRAHEQLVAYRKTIIVAVEDADEAIANYQAQTRSLESLALAMNASTRALDLAKQRYARGLTDFLNVVDAQRQEYGLEAQYTQAQQNAADALIYLYRAMGGGWESYQNVPRIRIPEPAAVAAVHRLLGNDDPQRAAAR
jgi:NodT family efflux transporter outer membrane factor (OMF) lipoprotein